MNFSFKKIMKTAKLQRSPRRSFRGKYICLRVNTKSTNIKYKNWTVSKSRISAYKYMIQRMKR